MTTRLRLKGPPCDATKMTVDGHSVVCAEYDDGSFALWRDGEYVGAWEHSDREVMARHFYSEMARLDRAAKLRTGQWQPIKVENGLHHVPDAGPTR